MLFLALIQVRNNFTQLAADCYYHVKEITCLGIKNKQTKQNHTAFLTVGTSIYL